MKTECPYCMKDTGVVEVSICPECLEPLEPGPRDASLYCECCMTLYRDGPRPLDGIYCPSCDQTFYEYETDTGPKWGTCF